VCCRVQHLFCFAQEHVQRNRLPKKGRNPWGTGSVREQYLGLCIVKSGKLASTKALYSFIIAFPLFLASSVCIMQYDAFYSIFRTMCDYRSVPGACVPDHLL